MDHIPEITSLIGTLPTHAVAKYGHRPLDLIRYIAIHHAASSERASPEEIAMYHVETKGWPGIAYHYCVGRDGKIYKCWPANTITYCVKGHNSESLCICLLGNRDENPAPAPQLKSAIELARMLRLAYAIPVDRILGHNEFEGAETACPGRYTNMSYFRAQVAALDQETKPSGGLV